jgi:hypothetical protein
MSVEEIQSDYADWLDEVGLTEYDVAFLMHEGVVIDCTSNKENLWVAPSRVASLGVLANCDLPEGETWVATSGNVKYVCGRFINHSPEPNCIFEDSDNGVVCRLSRSVSRGEELFVNYRSNLENLRGLREGIEIYKSALSFSRSGVILTQVNKMNGSQDQIDAFNKLEAELMTYPQGDCPITNRFTKGLYAREMFIPKDTLLTGALHKTQHIFVISKGDISTWFPGGEVTRVQAPFTGITEPGSRRLGYAHEDTVWTTFHATEETDPDKIVEEITDTRPNPLLTESDYAQSGWKKSMNQTTLLEKSPV